MKSLREQFVDWARTKGDAPYNFYSLKSGEHGCAATQFTHELGWASGSQEWSSFHGKHDHALRTEPWTFGALADRLEAMK